MKLYPIKKNSNIRNLKAFFFLYFFDSIIEAFGIYSQKYNYFIINKINTRHRISIKHIHIYHHK